MSLSKAELIQYFQNIINEISQYYLEIGVFTTTSKRKVKVGITNAELMFIHENGSPLHNIPARPVLQMTVEYASKNLLMPTIYKCLQASINGQQNAVETELNKLAIRIENYARDIIYSNDGRLAPNSPRTIAKKGSDAPLLDTGQLARSIVCRVMKR